MNNVDSENTTRVVLSVEDDDAAYLLIRTAFRDLGSEVELERVVNGEDALEFLKRNGKFVNAPKPSLILLNMNLPRIGGPEVLAEMRADEALRDIPVVVFSSSQLDADRVRCLALGARQFISKPNTYNEFLQAIECACKYAQAG
jgi:CheY-like chemotaxis protein